MALFLALWASKRPERSLCPASASSVWCLNYSRRTSPLPPHSALYFGNLNLCKTGLFCSEYFSPAQLTQAFHPLIIASVLVGHFVAVKKYPDKSNFRKEGLILVHRSRVPFVVVRKSWWQELGEAIGYIASIVRKHRVMNVPFSIIYCRTQAMRWWHSQLMLIFPLHLINPDNLL